MTDIDLFSWWVISISGGSIFLMLVSIFLYVNSRPKRKESVGIIKNAVDLVKDFVFVWILLDLLVFYIISIKIGSALIFAAGNIFVENLLLVYLIKNRQREKE